MPAKDSHWLHFACDESRAESIGHHHVPSVSSFASLLILSCKTVCKNSIIIEKLLEKVDLKYNSKVLDACQNTTIIIEDIQKYFTPDGWKAFNILYKIVLKFQT